MSPADIDSGLSKTFIIIIILDIIIIICALIITIWYKYCIRQQVVINNIIINNNNHINERKINDIIDTHFIKYNFDESNTQNIENDCVICNDSNNENSISCKQCKNTYHEICIKTWLYTKNTCPVCRKEYLIIDTII